MAHVPDGRTGSNAGPGMTSHYAGSCKPTSADEPLFLSTMALPVAQDRRDAVGHASSTAWQHGAL